MGKEYRDAEWLRSRYWDDGMTYAEMADECDVSVSTIQDWMNKHDIDRRSRAEAKRRASSPWVGITSDGYTEVQHQHDGETYSAKIHRLCAVAWFGIDYANEDIHVHHDSGFGFDNREENLEPKSVSEHHEHHWDSRDRSGLDSAVLVESDVREIYERCESEKHSQLADEFGVHKSTISAIATGRNWSHITDNE